jgi:hypothetical protein
MDYKIADELLKFLKKNDGYVRGPMIWIELAMTLNAKTSDLQNAVNQMIAEGFITINNGDFYQTDKGKQAIKVGIQQYLKNEEDKEQKQKELTVNMIKSIKEQEKSNKWTRNATILIIIITAIGALPVIIEFIRKLIYEFTGPHS